MHARCAKREKAQGNSQSQCGKIVYTDALYVWNAANLGALQHIAKPALLAEIQHAPSERNAKVL